MSYISLERFADRYNVTVKTVKRRYKEIPGVEKLEEGFRVLEGSRYPFPISKYKINKAEEKRYALLKAISRYQHIDADMLKIPEPSFNLMIHGLLDAGLIAENYTGNTYGANAYDCTEKGDEILKKKKSLAIKKIFETAGDAVEIVGRFTGAAVAAASVS